MNGVMTEVEQLRAERARLILERDQANRWGQEQVVRAVNARDQALLLLAVAVHNREGWRERARNMIASVTTPPLPPGEPDSPMAVARKLLVNTFMWSEVDCESGFGALAERELARVIQEQRERGRP